MSDLSVYGSLVTAPEVEAAITFVIEERIKEYVARIERHTAGWGDDARKPESIALPKSFITRNDQDHWPEEMLPSVVVTAPGLADTPKMEGDGTYRATWRVGIGVVVGASSIAKAEELAKLYGAAVRELLIQNPGLEGFSEGVIWEDERYDEIPNQDNLNVAAAAEIFAVEVRGVANRRGGTAVTPDDPYIPPDDLDLVEDASVTVQKEGNA